MIIRRLIEPLALGFVLVLIHFTVSLYTQANSIHKSFVVDVGNILLSMKFTKSCLLIPYVIVFRLKTESA